MTIQLFKYAFQNFIFFQQTDRHSPLSVTFVKQIESFYVIKLASFGTEDGEKIVTLIMNQWDKNNFWRLTDSF